MRPCHYVRENKTSETPSRVLVVKLHIVATPIYDGSAEYAFDFGCVRLGVRSKDRNAWLYSDYTFKTAAQFWPLMETLCQTKTRTHCLISDSRKTITLLNVFTTAQLNGWTLTQAVIECPPMLCRWRKDRKTLSMFDRSNIWPTVLSDTCTGNPKAHDASKLHGSEQSPCVHDVQLSVAKTMSQLTEWLDFLKTNNLGGFAPTIGAQAMRVFRHRYMHHKILIDCHDDALELARKAYRGARTECLYVGTQVGHYYLLDANSMYGAIMHDMWVPVRLRGYTHNATVDDLRRWSEHAVVIAECTVNCTQAMFGMRKNAELVFCRGRFTVCLPGPEAVLGMRENVIESVLRVAVYDRELAFRPFVDAMWGRRRQAAVNGNDADAEKYKRILTSFYGKWGQSGKRWEKDGDTADASIKTWLDVDYETRAVTEFRQFGGIVQKRIGDAESRDSHPAIAACITAGGRVQLWEWMCAAKLEHVYYVATDSLIVDELGLQGLRRYIKPDALGGLRIQREGELLSIDATGRYTIGNLLRHAGIRSTALQLDARTFEQNENHSMDWGFKHGDLGQTRDTRVRKTFTKTYAEGRVEKDGRVKPYEN